MVGLNMDLNNIPDDLIEIRRVFVSENITEKMQLSSNYIRTRYDKLDKLEEAMRFCSFDLLDAARSDGTNLFKLAFFPWSEAAEDFDIALNLIISSYYKNSYDSLRRALELVVVASFYTLDNADSKKAREWVTSKKSTPNFRRNVEKIVKIYPYNLCEDKCNLSEFLFELYYYLSDYIHVKGINASHRKFVSSMHNFCGISIYGFSEESCSQSLNIYLETVGAVALLCALCNPILLIGFDLERKFGLNPPASGLFELHQSERLWFLFPDRFKEFMEQLRKTDPSIQSVQEYIEQLPDMTDEEFKNQCDDFVSMFSVNSTQNNDGESSKNR